MSVTSPASLVSISRIIAPYRRSQESILLDYHTVRILHYLPRHQCNLTRIRYMFTALAAGGDLFSYLVAQGDQLDDWNSRVITRQIALAMTYIHSKGIAHRDIKPENILVTQTDFGGRVVLTDFGFANHVNARTGRMMSRVGTRGYIAP